MKYAMVPINTKYNDMDQKLVRRVLISYEDKFTEGRDDITYFKGTKLIDVDLYFLDNTKSHQYSFCDDFYRLVSSNSPNDFMYILKGMYEDRKYHVYKHLDKFRDFSGNIISIYFECNSDEEAKEIFHKREELR